MKYLITSIVAILFALQGFSQVATFDPGGTGGGGTVSSAPLGSTQDYIPTSRTINGHPLTGNINVTASDVGLGNVTNESKATMFTSPTLTGTPVVPGYVPSARTVNSKSLGSNISLNAADIGLGNVTNESKATMFTNAVLTGAPTVPGYTPTSRTINGHPLTGNVTVTAVDLSLGNVTNESKATILNNSTLTGTPTAPTATAGNSSLQVSNTAFVAAIKTALLDSISRLNDSIVSLSAAIKNISGVSVFDLPITNTTLVASDSTDWRIVVNDNLAGKNLTKFKISWVNSPGSSATVTATLIRLRGTTQRTIMTSTGATLNAAATMNTSYDDLVLGDHIKIKYTYTGTTPPNGLLGYFECK